MAKRGALLDRVVEAEKPGIVYVATKRGTEEIAEPSWGAAGGRRLPRRHKSEKRKKIEEAFLEDGAEVTIATTSLGVGVNKPDVRCVFHRSFGVQADDALSRLKEIGAVEGGPADRRIDRGVVLCLTPCA